MAGEKEVTVFSDGAMDKLLICHWIAYYPDQCEWPWLSLMGHRAKPKIKQKEMKVGWDLAYRKYVQGEGQKMKELVCSEYTKYTRNYQRIS